MAPAGVVLAKLGITNRAMARAMASHPTTTMLARDILESSILVTKRYFNARLKISFNVFGFIVLLLASVELKY